VGPTNLIAASSFVLQLLPSPNDDFLYVLWSDSQGREYLSAYATDLSGVPQTPPLQTLNVSSLTQLNVDPTGTFAYALQLEDSAAGYTSTILLFHASASGMLTFDPNIQGVYGPSLFPTVLYGLSAAGGELYLRSEDTNNSEYWQRSVSPQSGSLAPDVLLFQAPGQDSVVLGTKVIIEYQSAMSCSQPRSVYVLPNQPDPTAQIVCSSSMLDACGTVTNVQLDPSGQYLFLTDPESQRVRVAQINLQKRAITDTGSSLPFTAQTPGFAFSPDGILVYAWLTTDFRLHVYRFDQTTGKLREGSTSVAMPQCGGFLPALR
jgi:hypothetical protein